MRDDFSGALSCQGDNTLRQQGRNSSETWLGFGNVDFGGALVQGFSVGYQFMCALLDTGGLKCAGVNSGGQLGTGASGLPMDPAVNVSGLTSGVKTIRSAFDWSCALLANGTVKCWGKLDECGMGSTPQLTTGITDAVDLSVGEKHGCVLTASGAVKCWGVNRGGVFGDNGSTNQCNLVPQTAQLGQSAVKIAVSRYHTCAILTDGQVSCWGDNTNFRVGNGPVGRTPPTLVKGLPDKAKDLGVGIFSTCVLTTSGSVYCWGQNGSGQLGTNSASLYSTGVPTQVVGLGIGIKSLRSDGDDTYCAVTDQDFLKCWGLVNDFAVEEFSRFYTPSEGFDDAVANE